MVAMSLMASAVKSTAFLVPDQVIYRTPKELQVLISSHDNKLQLLMSGSLKSNPQHPENLWRPVNLLSNCSPYNSLCSIFEEQALLDAQDPCLDSGRFSTVIAEKWGSDEKIIKFLMSTPDSVDISLLSKLMELKDAALGMEPQPHMDNYGRLCLHDGEIDDFQHLLYPKQDFFIPESNFDCRSIFITSETCTKDLLSVIAEYSVPQTSTFGSKLSMVVPYFTRRRRGHPKANNQVSYSKIDAQVISPLKSPDSIRLRPARKKERRKKVTDERDLYHRNYFHACESLLSFVLDKKRDSTTMISLRKSGPEISQLLTKFSAGIAGTGLAIIFSICFKVVCGGVPLCTTRLLNTSLAFGLFWLSSAVSKLRDTIVVISKNSNKEKLNQEELVDMVDKSMRKITFRAAALAVVVVLRFA